MALKDWTSDPRKVKLLAIAGAVAVGLFIVGQAAWAIGTSGPSRAHPPSASPSAAAEANLDAALAAASSHRAAAGTFADFASATRAAQLGFKLESSSGSNAPSVVSVRATQRYVVLAAFSSGGLRARGVCDVEVDLATDLRSPLDGVRRAGTYHGVIEPDAGGPACAAGVPLVVRLVPGTFAA